MRLQQWLLLTAFVLLARAVQAADPQPYSVHIQSTGNGALDSLLTASSQLVSLRTSAPAGPFALVGRAEDDIERLQTVLESYGYYRRKVSVTINGEALDDPELPTHLEAAPKEMPAKVEISLALGPLFHLRKVAIEGDIDAQARAAFKLKSGTPAVAADVLAARDALQTALQEEGHAFAKVDDPIAYQDAQEPVLDVSFKVDPGATYVLGDIKLAGLKRMHESFLRRRLLLHSGERYSPSKIERARTDLLSLGVFSGITVRPPQATDVQDGKLPITFDLQERPRHAVTLSAGFSSDLGGSGGATWTDRNVFGNAEQLNLSASLINWGGSDSTGLGYNLGAQLTKPDFIKRDQSLQFSLTALQQDLVPYDQTAATAGVTLSRKLTPASTVGIGTTVEEERIRDNNPSPYNVLLYYTLFSIPLTAKYDTTGLSNPLLDPLHGFRATLSIAPTESLPDDHAGVFPQYQTKPFTPERATFVISQASVATYFDLARLNWTTPGRSVIALRGIAADAHGAGQFSLPPDQRFYGGGSTTVRGFSYQSIGPQFCLPTPTSTPANPCSYNQVATGGTELVAAGAEFRQRLYTNWGAAVFIDAGAVNTGEQPLKVLRCEPSFECGVGYGVGARYYTPIGPIRLDVALPVVREPGGNAVEVYVGIGQAF